MKTKAWHRTFATWIGLFFVGVGINNVANHGVSSYWFAATTIVYFLFTIAVTVGYHRLFTHRLFECSRFWHWFFGIIGCISMSASPAAWVVVHTAHHMYSDTPQDPHDTNWKYYFHLRDRTNMKVTPSMMRLLKDPMHKFLKDYSFGVFLAYCFITMFVSFNCFVFAAAAPVGIFMLAGGLHTIYSHTKLQPRNQWVMEFLIPLSGEWIHKEHHDQPRLHRWNTKARYFDVGGVFIDMIKKNAKSTS